MIHVLRAVPTPEQIAEMLEPLGDYIKLAVDVSREVLAGGGEMHSDCEQALLDDGSRQDDVWGADWVPQSRAVRYGSLINLRSRQGNRSMEIQDAALRLRVERVVRRVFEGA